ESFFQALFELADRGLPFEVAILGQHAPTYPEIFDQARERLGERLVHFGYAEDFATYAGWLWAADFLPVTSRHDFFGISVAEAAYCRTLPLLPRGLAYPELIPAGWQAICFYDGPDELVPTLAHWLHSATPSTDPLARAFAAFDWSVMAPHYDRKLAAVAGAG
ncbi:MAG: glycosyltransferase, partial [Thiohalorhabdaceae bacterium]